MPSPFQLLYEPNSFSFNKKPKKRVAAQLVGCDYYPAQQVARPTHRAGIHVYRHRQSCI